MLENALHPLHRSLESLGTRIDALCSQVEQIKRSNCNQYADRNYRSEANPEAENQEQTAVCDGTVREPAAVHLRFLDDFLKTPVYTERKLTAEGDKAIEIAIFRDNQIITSGPLSSARIEVVALHGDFLYVVPYNWTERDFTGSIVSNHLGPTLGGVCQVKLKNGVATLSDISFKKVSSKTDSGKLILAARVHRSDKGGLRVKEAVMNAVEVQVLRNQVNEKSNRPKLKDEVHRLNGISRNGQPLKKLQERDIYYVEDFLKAINKDKENIRNDCFNIKKDNKRWEATVKHAKECDLEGNCMLKLYRVDGENVELFFNCIHSLVGAKFNSYYVPTDKFSLAQEVQVDLLKKNAYDELAGIEFSYEMKEGGPMPLSTTTNRVIAGEVSVSLTGTKGPHPQGGMIVRPSTSEPNLPEPDSANGYEGNPESRQIIHDYLQVVADVGGQFSDILPREEVYGGGHCLGATQNRWDTINVDGGFSELPDLDISELENHGSLGLPGMSWQWPDSNCFLGDNSMEASSSTQINLLRVPFL